MHKSEIKAILDNAVLLCDTREQLNPRFRQRLTDTGMSWEKVKIDEGDYSIKCTLPDGSELSLVDKVGIERKKDLDELAACFGKDRDRFKREILRAEAKGKRLYLLVENAQLDYLFNDILYRNHCSSRFNRKAMLASIIAWQIRYGFTPLFTSERNSGQLIASVLKKELEIELERMCSDG